jgi:hypothetical protein
MMRGPSRGGELNCREGIAHGDVKSANITMVEDTMGHKVRA